LRHGEAMLRSWRSHAAVMAKPCCGHGEAMLRMNATPAELAALWLAPVMSVR